MPPQQDWESARRQILERLDISAEYTALGVRAAGSASSSGWVPVHAIDREDKTPSAAINIGEGESRGRYRDFGGCCASLSIFDFAVTYGGLGDYREAVKHYAKKAGVELPKSREDRKLEDAAVDAWGNVPVLRAEGPRAPLWHCGSRRQKRIVASQGAARV